MSKELQDRTKKFSLSIIDLVEQMDYSIAKKAVMNQITAQELLWVQIIERLAGREVTGNLFLK